MPPERRVTAAAALADLFQRKNPRTLLPLVLALSVLLHGAAVPFLVGGGGKKLEDLAASEDSYLRKVIQKDRAREVSKEVKNRFTMPPPPPDPEAVVSSTLTSQITTDIERVVGNMLDVNVTNKLASRVTADLSSELAEAAKTIAEGRLSEDEIKKLQEEFKAKAHERTVQALTEHREETQVQRARMTVKEWYENRVSAILRGGMTFELCGRQYNSGTVWGGYWNRSGWGFTSDGVFMDKVNALAGLLDGRYSDPVLGGALIEYGWRRLPDWPKLSAAQADAIGSILRAIYEQHPKGGAPSWADALALCLDSFYLHKPAVYEQAAGQLEALWQKAFAAAAAYTATAREEAAKDDELAAAQKACMAAVKDLEAAARKFWVGHERTAQYAAVNQAVRSRVLRGPEREKVYREIVDSLVAAFAPAIQYLPQSEFRESILVRDKDVEEATAEIMGYFRRDVESVLPKARFDDLVFDGGEPIHGSKIAGKRHVPGEEDIARDEENLKKVLEAWPAEEKPFADERTKLITRQFHEAGRRVAAELAGRFIEAGRFSSRFYAFNESPWDNRVDEKLDARAMALAGRGQDVGNVTVDGLPDPSVSMVALVLGASKGHGASLEPVMTSMAPAYLSGHSFRAAVRPSRPLYPLMPAGWGRVTQPETKPAFSSPRCEGIPFLANFPKLDGDLRDWGKIRPLVLQNLRYQGEPKGPFLVYAAWNYLGFFFGYHVDQPEDRFCAPASLPERQYKSEYGAWSYEGDYLRLLFDTLDARSKFRGEPYLQEFVILPRGVEDNGKILGMERIIASRYYAFGNWRGNQTWSRIFRAQPEPAAGPDGTGPYRVTKFTKTGYTTEIFLPRSLFNIPVFCPGWYVGFECVVAVGAQPQGTYGQIWANPDGGREYGVGIERNDYPDMWGDLLLLGTDPRLAVQDADEQGSLSVAIVPGHSYLVTVIDPDRNVNLAAEDIVLVSAEVAGGTSPEKNDVEVFILKETGKNTSVFRGYVNTQPGRGREIQGAIELLPGQELRFGYLDLANAKGERNVAYHLNLPVAAGLTAPLASAR